MKIKQSLKQIQILKIFFTGCLRTHLISYRKGPEIPGPFCVYYTELFFLCFFIKSERHWLDVRTGNAFAFRVNFQAQAIAA